MRFTFSVISGSAPVFDSSASSRWSLACLKCSNAASMSAMAARVSAEGTAILVSRLMSVLSDWEGKGGQAADAESRAFEGSTTRKRA